MHGKYQTTMPLNEVTALFAASASSFRLSNRATFADLADRLDELGERHLGNQGGLSEIRMPRSNAHSVLPLSNETEGSF